MADIRQKIVEVTVNNNAVKQFALGSLPDIREAKAIKRIEAYNVSQLSVSPTEKAVINIDVFNKSYLKLVNPQGTELRNFPLSSISKTINGTDIPDLNIGPIDPEKSVIQVGNTAGLVAGEVFLLVVTYEK